MLPLSEIVVCGVGFKGIASVAKYLISILILFVLVYIM